MTRIRQWDDWLEARIRFLWIHGIPGAGKTILMSYLIEQIKERCEMLTEKHACIYYYCYHAHNQDETKPLLQWILCQLCRRAEYIPKLLRRWFNNGEKPDIVDMLKAVEAVLERYEVVYLMIDALDESKEQENLLRVLQDIATEPEFEKLHVIVSSREIIDIERILVRFSTPISMNNEFVREDIKTLVHSMLQSRTQFQRWPNQLLEEVEDALSEGASGM